MSNILFKTGKQNIGNKLINFAGASPDTFKASLLTMTTQTGNVYLVTGTAAAGVIDMTSTTGITVGDVVVVGGIGGTTSYNGTWQVLSLVTNTSITIGTLLDGNAVTSNASWTSGGYVVDVTAAATITNLGGNGGANGNGTDATISGITNTGGIINASAISWTGLSATKSYAVGVYDSSVSNDLIAWIDGMYQVYVITQASATATSIAIARLPVAIANGTTLVFSDGSSATLTAQANIGDTSLTVSSLAAIVHRQATADVVTYNTTASSTSGLPVTPGAGAGLTLSIDTGVNRFFVL